ncbi:MAG: ATP-binding protein [Candidatus Hodarchaeota archaeon]
MVNSFSLETLLERDDVPNDAKTIIKRAIAQLQEDREITQRYQTLYKEVPIGLYRTTPDGQILESNPFLVEMLGYKSLEDLKKFNLEKESERFHPSYPRAEFKRRLEKDGSIRGLEVRWQKKDGAFMFVRENAKGVFDNSGKILYYEGSVEDITDKKEAEEELRQSEKRFRESEERLRAFMDSATDAIELWDSDFHLIECNQAVVNEFPEAKKKEDLIGKHIIELIPDLKTSGRYDQYLKVIQTGKPFSIESISPHPKFGDKFYSVKAFKVGDGIGMITSDITDRKRNELMRNELEKQRDNFVWMTSHELRTPITVLSGYLDFLKQNLENLDHDQIERIFKVMANNINRLGRLTTNVTMISKVERRILEVVKKEVNLLDFLMEAIEAYQHLVGEQFEFIPSIDQSLIVKIDKERIQQVLDNILNNAIKNTHHDRRKIKMTVKDLPTDIEIIISDNGAGIDPVNLTKIFKQFVSIETEFSASGTGIGLFLSREIMNTHGGTITAYSKGLGHGSKFIVFFPKQ